MEGEGYSRCAQYKSGSCIPCKRHHCHTSRRLCALLYQPLCFTVCSAVPCPQTVLPTTLLHPQGQTTTVLQGPHPTAASHGPLWGLGQHICNQISTAQRQMRCISTWSHDSHVTNSGACVAHCYTLKCRLICTGTCICMASLRACVCCFCSLHCSHL